MTGFDQAHHEMSQFDEELADDIRFERALSRRCLYAIGLVVAVILARTLWFI